MNIRLERTTKNFTLSGFNCNLFKLSNFVNKINENVKVGLALKRRQKLQGNTQIPCLHENLLEPLIDENPCLQEHILM